MEIRELHNKAMELAALADLQKVQENKDKSFSLFEEAFYLERKAAMTAYDDNVGEPTVSVLLRNAASLAVNCKKLRDAEKLIALALSGEPPLEIAEELRNLLENVNFHRHLEVKGTELSDDEVQLAVAGNGSNQTIKGILKVANATTNTVQIIIDANKINLKVPNGLSEIVRKYWNERVIVEYYIKNKKDNVLISIEED